MENQHLRQFFGMDPKQKGILARPSMYVYNIYIYIYMYYV